jgi:hypothetical protein
VTAAAHFNLRPTDPDAKEPGSYRLTDCAEIAAQPVIAGYLHHRA